MGILKPQAVVLTVAFDPHADHIVRLLTERGRVNVFRINTDQTPSHTSLTIALDDRSSLAAEIAHTEFDRTFDPTQMCSVWFRRPGRVSLPEGVEDREALFIQAETSTTLMGILYSSTARWVNDPGCERRASNKVSQLVEAQRVGLSIPATIITSDADRVRTFLGDHPEVIYKPLSHPASLIALHQDHVQIGPTQLLTAGDEQHLDNLANCPSCFQEYVPKEFEIRATVIGERVFSVAIDSQSTERGRVDYREVIDTVDMEFYQLPAEVEQKILLLTKSFGLVYAAIDLIVKPDGNHVFLDLNPSGQYLFVEHAVPALRMSDALCDVLEAGIA